MAAVVGGQSSQPRAISAGVPQAQCCSWGLTKEHSSDTSSVKFQCVLPVVKGSEVKPVGMETEPSTECDPAELLLRPPHEPKEQLQSEESLREADRKENVVPKAFKRKISVVSASKCSPQGSVESEAGIPARKRRWGSSTVATQKKTFHQHHHRIPKESDPRH
ncbi:apoptotic chromatin condensation inducer in the nucleus-like [Stegostoma tigrinum]|uniref:apoptotic chromatin condensation inducer in the nucleus-like n=1 Tax=Stegostoma tigrinum TaxID=3053191 RepID=UPI002870889F|nr:apoptotic chromatin condensation inducer in the nucleus-like [Stegostoma tigrinum]